MKLKNPKDREIFIQELKDNKCPPHIYAVNEIEKSLDATNFLTTNRQKFSIKLKDFRKSQAQKHNWRTGRYKYLKGIREFAKSVEGKQFHRRLSRYLVSRGVLGGPRQGNNTMGINRNAPSKDEEYKLIGLGRYDISDLLVSLSSLRTHLFIEANYYQSLSEEVDYFVFLETFIDKINDMEKRLLDSMMKYEEIELNEDDKLFLEALLGDVEYEEEEISQLPIINLIGLNCEVQRKS